MTSNILQVSNDINALTQEIQAIKAYKERFLNKLKELDAEHNNKQISRLEYNKKKASLLKGKKKEEMLQHYNTNLKIRFDQIQNNINQIYTIIQPAKPGFIPIRTSAKQPAFLKLLKKVEKQEKEEKPTQEKSKFSISKEQPTISGEFAITQEQKKAYLKELNVTQTDIRKFLNSQKKRTQFYTTTEYTVYKSNPYSKLANTYMENTSYKLTRKYPEFFEPLFEALQSSNIKMLSKTYVSIILLSTILAFPVIAIITFLFTLSILKTFFFGILGSLFTLFLIYAYPFSVINGRRKRIKSELVFAIVHMAAVAGSGAKPTRIFKLLADSKEYRELEPEIRKILNYVNIFGYSLTTALRAAIETTPSPEFKELLVGIISTIETGGDIKKYLSDKAEDALTQYRIDQSKYLTAMSAYSDIYTGILIAAPLLFVVVLAIIEKISPEFGSLTVNTIASLGTFVLLPFLNIVFILFLEMTKTDI